MAQKLISLGYAVTKVTDVKRDGFYQVIKTFTKQSTGADQMLFFYAGHGMEVSGKNYLLPTDALLEDPEDCRNQAINVDDLMGDLGNIKARFNIVMLDACRNNPFRSWSRDVGGSRGFAPIASVSNTSIIYATKPGSVAGNGTGRNGCFTTVLLQYLQPGVSLPKLFQGILKDLRGTYKQEPHLDYGFTEDFTF